MSWEEYAQTKSNTLKVYFENCGKFLKHDDKNKRLTMVDSTDATTVFYLKEQCSVACMRLSYRLVIDESGESEYKFTGNISKGEQVTIDKCNEDESSNFSIKFDFNSFNEETNFPTVVSFIASKSGYYDYNEHNSVYAFDNYGDSRVVWWNLSNKNTNNNFEAKQNQKYNVIIIE